MVGLTPRPFSALDMINRLKMPISFHEAITTPPALRWAAPSISRYSATARYSFAVHMHDSGSDPYTFRVRCALTIHRAESSYCFKRAATPTAPAPTRSAQSTAISTIDEDGRHVLIQPNWLDITGRFNCRSASRTKIRAAFHR